MNSCPLYTIAMALKPDAPTGRAVCQEEECALWNEHQGMCAFLAVSDALSSLLKACLVAAGIPPLKDDKTPPP